MVLVETECFEKETIWHLDQQDWEQDQDLSG